MHLLLKPFSSGLTKYQKKRKGKNLTGSALQVSTNRELEAAVAKLKAGDIAVMRSMYREQGKSITYIAKRFKIDYENAKRLVRS